jgi:hypothetical protein
MSITSADPCYTPHGAAFSRDEWDRAHKVYMEDELKPRCSAAGVLFAASKIIMRPQFEEDGSLKCFMGHKNQLGAREAAVKYATENLNTLGWDEVTKSLNAWLLAHFSHNVTTRANGPQALVCVLVHEAPWHDHMQQLQNASNN